MPDVDLTVGANTSAAQAGLAELRNYGTKVQADLAGIFSKGFAVAGVAGLISAAQEAFAYGARIQDLSDKLGVNTTILQRWGLVADQNGSSTEALAQGFNKLIIAQSKANGGNAEMQKHFEDLGISIKDLKDLSPDEIAKKIGASSMDAADMVAIFGKNALELVPTFRAVADGTAEFGSAMDANVIRKLDQADDRIKRFQQWLRVDLGNSLAAAGEQLEGIKIQLADFWDALSKGEGWRAIGILGRGEGKTADFYRENRAREMVSGLQNPMERRRNISESDIGGSAPPGAPRASGAGGSSERLSDRLADIERQNLLKTLDVQEKIRAVEQERAKLQADLHDTETEAEYLAIQSDIAEKDGELLDLNKRRTAEQEKYNQRIIEEREQADAALETAERRNQVIALTAAGHGEIALKLQQQWEYEDKVADLTDRINTAWSEGNEELAETLTALRDQLGVEEELVAAAKERAAAEAAVAANARNWREGMRDFANNAGTNDWSGFAGNGGSPAEIMAMDMETGIIDPEKLRYYQAYYDELTNHGRNNLGFAEQAAIDQRRQQIAEIQTRRAQQNTDEGLRRAEAERHRINDLIFRSGGRYDPTRQYTQAQIDAMGLHGFVQPGAPGPIPPVTGSSSAIPSGGIGQTPGIPAGAGGAGAGATAPTLEGIANTANAILAQLQSTHAYIVPPPGSI